MEPTQTELMRIAAVSGALDPTALGRLHPTTAIEALADVCDEDIAGNRYRWRMRADARRQTLNALADRTVLRAVLRSTPAAEPGDDFGRALRQVLGRKSTRRIAAESLNAAHACHSALAFALDMPLFADRREAIAAEIAELRLTIAGQDRQRALEVVLPKGRKLFGRDRVLRSIVAFAKGKGSIRPIIVSGIGGIGKSALIATIMREADRSPDWAAILLDFDRPTLLNGEPFEIVREIARQMCTGTMLVIKGDPQASAAARKAVADMRGRLASRTANLREGFGSAETGAEATPPRLQLQRVEPDEQLSRAKSEVMHTLGALPQEIRTRPVLLIMDTFELIAGLSGDVVQRVLAVEDILRDAAGCRGIRTMLAGRALEPALETFAHALAPRGDWIRLEGLEARAGASLLAAEDAGGRIADEALRKRASEALKGHPLALQIFARYCQDRTARQIRALVDDISANADFQAEFAQRFLYSRILDRIPDHRLKALAHPGLVLRHVTPDLIRLVLAGPCGLGVLDAGDSAELFRKLAANHWLVSREGPDRVRHLPELRQHMLAAMLAPVPDGDGPAARKRKVELRDKARQVSLAAIAFYRDGPPIGDPAHDWWKGLSDAERHTEVLYHRALTEPAPPRMERADAAQLRTGIGEDFESLPKAWRALVKAETGNLGSLSSAERETLSGPLRERATKQRLDTLEKAGAFEAVATEAVRESTRRTAVKEQEQARQEAPDAGNARHVEISSLLPLDQKIGGFERKLTDATELSLRPGARDAGEGISQSTGDASFEAAGNESPVPMPPKMHGASVADLDLAAQTTRAAFMHGDIEQAAAEAAPLLSAFLANEHGLNARALLAGSKETFWRSGLWLGALAQAATGSNFIVRNRVFTSGSTNSYDELATIALLHVVLDQSGAAGLRRDAPFLLADLSARMRQASAYEDTRVLGVSFSLFPDMLTASDGRARSLRFTPSSLSLLSGPAWALLISDGRNARRLRETAEPALAAALDENRIDTRQAETLYRLADALMVEMQVLCETGEASRLLRGLTPELHTPAAAMLDKVPAETAGGFVRELVARAPHWPIDLHFGDDGNAPKPRHFGPGDAMTVVITADRCGILPDLLQLLLSFDPRAATLLRVHETITERLFAWKETGTPLPA